MTLTCEIFNEDYTEVLSLEDYIAEVGPAFAALTVEGWLEKFMPGSEMYASASLGDMKVILSGTIDALTDEPIG